jgi:hypothetical protein
MPSAGQFGAWLTPDPPPHTHTHTHTTCVHTPSVRLCCEVVLSGITCRDCLASAMTTTTTSVSTKPWTSNSRAMLSRWGGWACFLCAGSMAPAQVLLGSLPRLLCPVGARQVICFPENVTFSDYNSALPFLRQDEVCHVLLLAIESRRQSELLYALNALMAHVNG